MKKVVQRLLPTRSEVQSSTSSFKKSLKLDNINLIEEFFIELNDPHKKWKPGESIIGTVTLDLKKNITNVNITLTLIGYIKLKQGNAASTVRNKPHCLFSHTALVYGTDSIEPSHNGSNQEPTIGLSKGEHRFPFSMKLPRKNIYTSITFEKGSIAYKLRASINHNSNSVSPLSSLNSSPASLHSGSSSTSSSNILFPSKHSIHHCEKTIQIIVPINVAKIPKPQTRIAYLSVSDKKLKKTISSTSTANSNYTLSTNNSDHSSSSNENHPLSSSLALPTTTSTTATSSQSLAQAANSSPIRLAVDIPQSGYLRGELIPIKINVSHYKPIQSSSGIIVTLIRICRVDSGPETPIQSFRKDLYQSIAPLYIDPEKLTCEVRTSLKVPVDAFPSIVGSDIVSFQYYIEVLANVSSKNLISNNSSSGNGSGNQKFSHSIVFDMDSSSERDLIKSSENREFVNVDKLKRAKNLLGLNTEIIVGTERVAKTKYNIGKKAIVQNAINKNNSTLQNNGTHSDCSIMEAISQTSISPLSINGNPYNAENGTHGVNDTGIPVTFADQETNGLSEKAVLRMQEEALLPSEPRFNSIPAPSYSTNDMLEEMPSAPSPSIVLGMDPAASFTSPTAPPMPSSPLQSFSQPTRTTIPSNTSEDKLELERRRLQQLESDPPEFDYVPEYVLNPSPSNPTRQSQSSYTSQAPVVSSTSDDSVSGSSGTVSAQSNSNGIDFNNSVQFSSRVALNSISPAHSLPSISPSQRNMESEKMRG